MKNLIAIAESGFAPDFLMRLAIRRLVRSKLSKLPKEPGFVEQFARDMRHNRLTLEAATINDQHCEEPAAFFESMLGPNLKYSCSLYDNRAKTLAQAEEDMLMLTANRASLQDGMTILELGCGWGSLTLFMAKRYPTATIMAVSESENQRLFIKRRAEALGLRNIQLMTCDLNDFDVDTRFDRVVSIEMFEHMRNYPLLFEKITGWLNEDGKLFFHIFCHRTTPYYFSEGGSEDWMTKQFPAGELMPSFDLPLAFSHKLVLEGLWQVNGLNYAKTCRSWLRNLDDRRSNCIYALALGSNNPKLLFNRWRLSIIAREELFAYNEGNEWFVAHYLFSKES